jgi:hypothetical protein
MENGYRAVPDTRGGCDGDKKGGPNVPQIENREPAAKPNSLCSWGKKSK